MDPLIVDYIDRLHANMAGLEEALTGLPVEALDWSPGPELNSLTVLATHAAGATRYWIGDVVGRDPSNRVREQEFEMSQRDEAALKARLAEVMDHAQRVLAGLTAADLGELRGPTRFGDKTVAWALLRALDHLAEHVGHAQMTRQLWNQRQA
jgi:uncharacterized damage-inducible protein DinB